MYELNRLDRSVERPTYNNEEIAELHQAGLLGRPEAEVLDIIIRAGFAQDQKDDPVPPPIQSSSALPLMEPELGYEDEQEVGDSSQSVSIAIIYEGSVIPILHLEEILQQPGTMVEKLALCRQIASIIYDVILTLLDKEGGS